MNRRLSTFRQRVAVGVATVAVSAVGLAIGPAAPAHAVCAAVEVSSNSGKFCVVPTPQGTPVSASGDTTVKNNTAVPVKAKADTGAEVTVPPGGNDVLNVHGNAIVKVG
ncbi:hypothetical protein AB0F13_00940 [Streptomyces sp. NPDC026206]|uniref:hypothetical protein n=1 Tax=Streptomyces sp. NPDC026206 TaxID=3157089 RepID=UPI0034013C96